MSTMEVILVDEQDSPLGTCEKNRVHVEGKLHRAFSIFIFSSKGEMLLQQRADDKYHSGGLWTNACCSHPLPNEETNAAAIRRLEEELGFMTPVKKIFDFIYKAELDNGLTEHEFDHVFAGEYDGVIPFNTDEVKAIEYRTMSLIKNDLGHHPENYTAWFRIAFPRIETWWNKFYGKKLT